MIQNNKKFKSYKEIQIRKEFQLDRKSRYFGFKNRKYIMIFISGCESSFKEPIEIYFLLRNLIFKQFIYYQEEEIENKLFIWAS